MKRLCILALLAAFAMGTSSTTVQAGDSGGFKTRGKGTQTRSFRPGNSFHRGSFQSGRRYDPRWKYQHGHSFHHGKFYYRGKSFHGGYPYYRRPSNHGGRFHIQPYPGHWSRHGHWTRKPRPSRSRGKR